MDNRLHGLRITNQRALLYEYLTHQSLPKTPEEIFEELPNGSMDLSTVYRTLDTFFKVHLIQKSFIQNKVYYHLTTEEHKHYLVCIDCHEMSEIDLCPFHEFESKIEHDTDFLITYHPVELYGYCKKCKPNHQGFPSTP